jgi:hypothetical protein
MNSIVYITTNLTNGKKYIGASNGKNPYYLGSGKLLKKAIKVHGASNFKRETLWEGPKEFAREIEEYWIEYFNASKNPLFYNLSECGVGNLLGNSTTLGKNWVRTSTPKIRSDKGLSKPQLSGPRKKKYLTPEDAKVAQKAQMKAWNEKNKEKVKEYNIQYKLK